MEQLNYNLLLRWFVGLNTDEAVWDPTVFSKNRDRLLAGDVAQAFFAEVLEVAREHRLLSDEHFTVDGTLLEAWAGHKTFKRKDRPPSEAPADVGNAGRDFRGEPRGMNRPHRSWGRRLRSVRCGRRMCRRVDCLRAEVGCWRRTLILPT